MSLKLKVVVALMGPSNNFKIEGAVQDLGNCTRCRCDLTLKSLRKNTKIVALLRTTILPNFFLNQHFSRNLIKKVFPFLKDPIPA